MMIIIIIIQFFILVCCINSQMASYPTDRAQIQNTNVANTNGYFKICRSITKCLRIQFNSIHSLF
jgi:hypothetical protein